MFHAGKPETVWKTFSGSALSKPLGCGWYSDRQGHQRQEDLVPTPPTPPEVPGVVEERVNRLVPER